MKEGNRPATAADVVRCLKSNIDSHREALEYEIAQRSWDSVFARLGTIDGLDLAVVLAKQLAEDGVPKNGKPKLGRRHATLDDVLVEIRDLFDGATRKREAGVERQNFDEAAKWRCAMDQLEALRKQVEHMKANGVLL